MLNVMASRIDGALCEGPQFYSLYYAAKNWLTPAAGVPCNNAANIAECKTWT